jgi:PhnB protein
MTRSHDPFEDLALPREAQQPRPRFARDLRARLVEALDLDDPEYPTVQLPRRRTMSTTTPTTPAVSAPIATVVTPYLTASDAAAALDWYAEAFGAVETFRVVGDDGRLGHAEFTIGAARFMLSDEYPEMGVRSPSTLGGTPTAMHLEVTDVDTLYARAVAAGATAQGEPADQPHGSRHGTLLDPFGHRWMLSQPVEAVDLETYAERSEGSSFTVVPAAAGGEPDEAWPVGGIWAGVSYRDALAGIRFLVDVFGFDDAVVVVADDGTTVVHSELRWPAGGIVQAGTYAPDNEFMQAPGAQSLYVITPDPHSVWERCQAAGVEVVRPPESPHYDPGGMGFSVRDPEGNIWSFGSYAGGAG